MSIDLGLQLQHTIELLRSENHQLRYQLEQMTNFNKQILADFKVMSADCQKLDNFCEYVITHCEYCRDEGLNVKGELHESIEQSTVPADGK